jgi:hypothetical protein
MPPKPTNWALYGKMAGTFLSLSIGGPAFVYWLSPTEEELFLKYNPDLQKRSLENRIGKQQDFDNFVGKLKEYSKSDRPSMFPGLVRRRRESRYADYVQFGR